MKEMPERPIRFVVRALSTLCLLFIYGYAAAATVTFSYVATDGAGATVSGTFGYDTSTPDINANTSTALYLTGFLTGTIIGGAADGFNFNLDLSGEQSEGHMATTVSTHQFFSSFWMNELADVGEYHRISLESLSTVLDDTSLPTELNVADWDGVKSLDIRSHAPDANLFEFTEITVIPPSTGQFGDVSPDYWAFSFIETLANSGITAGCGGSNYCPTAPVTRAQMAVFLERGINGSDFIPPVATGNAFLDVGAGDFAANFIEQLASDGITAGCGNNNYCPNAEVR